MSKGIKKNIGRLSENCFKSAKSIVKMALESRRIRFDADAGEDKPLIVLGNGPSLAATIAEYGETALAQNPLMAVNFAACAPEFVNLKPRYYLLADPTFFAADAPEKVMALWQNFADLVTWQMSLFVPFEHLSRVRFHNPHIKIEGFNFVGAEGFRWLTHKLFDAGCAMPRPRNVLVPAIMVGIQLGYKRIFITGADHTWTKTLSVDDDNRLVTVQPHFYKDDEAERERLACVYRDIHMHDILLSFHIAFKSYFAVEDYARSRGVDIFNATPGSFIDAFRRKSLSEID